MGFEKKSTVRFLHGMTAKFPISNTRILNNRVHGLRRSWLERKEFCPHQICLMGITVFRDNDRVCSFYESDDVSHNARQKFFFFMSVRSEQGHVHVKKRLVY